MLKYIDRQLVRSYFKAYFICLLSLLSLYVIVDLFTNLDEFSRRGNGFFEVLKQICFYYALKVTHIYDRLSEIIALLAAMFAIAWMQHCNELIPLLSAGISTRRVLLPILISAAFMIGVSIVNQEMVIPRIGMYLLADKDDPHGDKDIPVLGAFEPNGVHIEGRLGSRHNLTVHDFFCMIPEGISRSMLHLQAQESRYIPRRPGERRTGGWLLTNTTPASIDGWDRPEVMEIIDPGKYFLYTAEVDFDMITRNGKWYTVASTGRLYTELQKPDSTRLATIAVLFHTRLTRPIMGMILVILGLSVILRDQNRNVFLSAGMCLVLCGIFFAVFFACKSLGDNDVLSPALSAWLPVLLFGPLALVMFDAVHT